MEVKLGEWQILIHVNMTAWQRFVYDATDDRTTCSRDVLFLLVHSLLIMEKTLFINELFLVAPLTPLFRFTHPHTVRVSSDISSIALVDNLKTCTSCLHMGEMAT